MFVYLIMLALIVALFLGAYLLYKKDQENRKKNAEEAEKNYIDGRDPDAITSKGAGEPDQKSNYAQFNWECLISYEIN